MSLEINENKGFIEINGCMIKKDAVSCFYFEAPSKCGCSGEHAGELPGEELPQSLVLNVNNKEYQYGFTVNKDQAESELEALKNQLVDILS